ncbi:MAG: hypothetical protein R3F11_26380 [Verrucomicrobiales bacterium]
MREFVENIAGDAGRADSRAVGAQSMGSPKPGTPALSPIFSVLSEQDRFIEREIGARDEKLCALVHDEVTRTAARLAGSSRSTPDGRMKISPRRVQHLSG